MNGPLFVKVDNYKQINDLIESIKANISSSKRILGDIEKLKAEEDSYIDKWKKSIEELEKRTENMDQMLYKVDV